MSWAEVKKINSNLDVPLDKIIVPNGKMIVNSGSDYSNNPSLMVEVNARALLYTLNVYNTLDTSENSKVLKCTTNVKITIDGEVYDNVKLIANESNTRQYYLRIANSYAISALPIRAINNNDKATGWFGGDPTVYTYQYNGFTPVHYTTGPHNDNISSVERIINGANTSYVYIPIIAPLVVKKGFKVEFSGDYNETTSSSVSKSINYKILYTLLE